MDPFYLRKTIALLAEDAAEQVADAEYIHGFIHDLLILENADGQNAWYEAREADPSMLAGHDGTPTTDQSVMVDNFSADLDLASSVAAGLTRPVAPLCRYALMRSSARSLADRLSIPLLAAVVEKAVWSPETGLAYLRRLPEGEQATAAMALAMWIPEETSKRLIEEGRSLAAAERAVLDGCLLHAPSLYRPLLQQMWAATGENHWPGLVDETAAALAALVPSLPPATLQEAAGFLAHCDRSINWDPARAAIAGWLADSGMADQALELTADLVGHLAWVDTLDEVLARMDEERRAAAVAAELETALGTGRDLVVARRLSPLLPHLPSEERATVADAAVRAAVALEVDDGRVEALLGLLPRLDGAARDQAVASLLAAVRSPGPDQPWWEWPVVRALARVLPPAQVRHLLAPLVEALSFGPTPLPDVLDGLPDDLAVELAIGSLGPSAIAACLPPDKLTTLVMAALEDAADSQAGSNDARRHSQALFVAQVAPQLPEVLVRQAIAAAAPTEGLYWIRTDLLAYLLPQLARLGHVQEALREIRERLHGHEATAALIRMAPLLERQQLEEALDILEEVVPEYDAYYRDDGLAGLAPFLDGPQLRRALSLSGALGDREEMIGALTAFAELLVLLDQVDDALTALNGIPDPVGRAHAAVKGAKYLAADERGPLLAAGMAASAAITEGRDKAKALARLIPLYEPHQRELAQATLVAALTEVKDDHHRVGELLVVADALPEAERAPLLQRAAEVMLASRSAGELPPLTPREAQWLRRFRNGLAQPVAGPLACALLTAWAVGDGRGGVESLAGFLARLPEDERLPLIDQATALAYTIPDPSLRARILVTMTPLYPSADRRIMVRVTLDEALEHRDRERIDLLSDLAAWLPDEERPLVVARLFQAMAYPQDVTPRSLSKDGSAWTSTHLQTLIAPCPTGPVGRLGRCLLPLLGRICPLRFPTFQRNSPPLDQGSATAVYLTTLPKYDRDAAARAHAAVEVARRLPERERRPLLERALLAARDARYASERSKALLEVAAISHPAMQRPLVDEALAAARAIEQESALPATRATCLAELLPLLDADRREVVAAEALAALFAEEHDPGMPDALADHLSEPLVREMLDDLESAGDNTWRAARLLPLPAALGHPTEALAGIAALPDLSHATRGLAACARHLPEPQVWDALRLAESLGRAPGGTTDRAIALLLVRLAELGHPEAAIARARAELHHNHWMPTVVSMLLNHVPEAERAELALDALAAIQRLSPRSKERDAMRALAAEAMAAPRPALLEWLQTILRELSLGPRSTLLRDLAGLGAVIMGLDGGDALSDVSRAVGDTCRWWPADINRSQPMSWRPATTTPGHLNESTLIPSEQA